MPSQSTILGAAGEHLVMCQLLRRGLIAALAPTGVPNCDIVVSDQIGSRLCAVQVKARRALGSDGGWHMGKKHEALQEPRLFYVFVDFGRNVDSPPTCFIVPSIVVARVLRDAHSAWLSTPGKRGQERKDTDFRRFLPDYGKVGIEIGCGAGWLEKFRNSWALLTEELVQDN